MEYFYTLKVKSWKRWFIVISFALFTALFIWSERHGVYSVFSEQKPVALTKGNANVANIALTFNISWGEEKVHDILKQLKKEQVRATFFVSGEWAERHPEIVEKIVKDEHELGMLGYRYKSYLNQEINQVRKDLIYAKEIFRKLGYEDITLLRPPNGHFNKEIIQLADGLGYNVVHWNINPNDWENPGKVAIIDHVMKRTDNGDILLLHASDSAKQTAEALQTILPGLQNKGFHFVAISELFNEAHSKIELIE